MPPSVWKASDEIGSIGDFILLDVNECKGPVFVEVANAQRAERLSVEREK
jgi:hypothetical protein